MIRNLVSLCVITFICLKANSQVNMVNGSAEQGFPLINFVDSKSGLTLNVAANYSSGNGLVISSLASNLGTGWTLDFGGIITRVQVGQPDDQPGFDNGQLTGAAALKRYPPGYLYNNAVGLGCPKGTNNFPVFKDDNVVYKQKNNITADLEQDKFIYTFNGHTGSFIIGRDRKPITIGDSRIKISFGLRDMTAQGIRTTIDTFAITAEDGIKYVFSAKALVRLTRYKYAYFTGTEWKAYDGVRASDAPRALNRFYGFPLANDERPYVVTSWYLTQIINTNNNERISFEYDDVTYDLINGKYISHSRDLNNSGRVRDLFANSDRKKNGKNWFNLLSNPSNALLYSSNTNYLDKLKPGPTSLTYLHSITINKRIKRIVLPNNGEILVKYNTLPRVDLPGDNPISSVEYYLRGKLVRGYEFAMGYMFKNAIRGISESFTSYESKFARLCLLSIRKFGNAEDNASEPPYRFEYYLGTPKTLDDIVPARNYLSQDHWGYYNGNTAGLSLTEDHDFLSDPENQYFKMVLYNYHNPKPGYAKNGLLRAVIFPTGGVLTYEYLQNQRPGFPTNLYDGGVSVVKTTLSDNEDVSRNIVTDYSYVLTSGKSSRWGYEQPSYTSLSHMIYDEKWGGKKYKYPGIEYPEMGVNSPSSSFNWGRFLMNTAIAFVAQTAIAALLPASAVPVLNAVVLAASIAIFIINALKEFEFHRFNLTNSNDILGNSVGGIYARVEMRSNSPTGYNGKSVFEYTGPSDYPLLVGQNTWPYTRKQRTANWAYGLLKKVTVYDKNNILVSEKQNDYKIYLDKIADAQNINCSCDSRDQYSMRSDDWAGLGGYVPFDHNSLAWITSSVKPQAYYSYTGRTDLNAVYQKDYQNGILYSARTTNIINDPMALLQKGEVVQKDPNAVLVKTSYYPQDYTIAGALQILKANNAIHTPVATETWMLKVNGISNFTMSLIDATVTEFKTIDVRGKTVVKPWKTYILKTNAPIPYATIGPHNPALLIRKPEFFKQTSEMIYDVDGNLVQTISNDQPTSFINDYSSRYVVATVANASYNDIAYTSFESDGTGNWNFNSSSITPGGVTGTKCFQLGSSSITTSKSLNATTAYVVTYWYKPSGGSATINGSEGQLLLQRADGWQLYKHVINERTSITINGLGLIDEVRLHPQRSLMATAVYKEGVGKIAESDANNRLIFHEFDALGRLKLDRDQNGNVIKTFEYNYKN